MDHQQLVESLAENICVVTFTKINGQERTMTCTRSAKIIPQKDNLDTTSRRQSPATCSVWSVEDAAWRSFRLDSVITWNKLDIT